MSNCIPDDPAREDGLPRPNTRSQSQENPEHREALARPTYRITTRRIDELQPHPRYAHLGLTAQAFKLNALIERGEDAFLEPLTITSDGIVIDGYARWELARTTNRMVLTCVEYELSEVEALQWLLQKHGRSRGRNAFSRIMLALGLEPLLMEKARSNQQIGGRQKGWSKLTKAEQVHVRSEIAKAAAVSVGNVTKVKQLRENCPPAFCEALYNDEISIHWAWQLRNASPEDQLDALGRLRFEKGLLTEIRHRVALRRKRGVSHSPNASEIVNRLTDLKREELEAVRVTVLKGAEPEIFITETLARKIGLEQLRIWNQSTCYENSPRIRESFGTGRNSDSRSATI